jgi:glycosyltransferase involved in cell wall biosynthesis
MSAGLLHVACSENQFISDKTTRMPYNSNSLLSRPALRTASAKSGRSRRPSTGETRSPIRVLHVVSHMNRAGIETWLMHVLRQADRSRFQMDFLVHTDETCQYDDEIRSLGGHLLRATHLRNIWKYARTVKDALHSAPPYDIVHSHLDFNSGYALRCANQAGVPVRIAHSHLDLARSFPHLKWRLKLYALRSRSLILRHATHGLAASRIAGESLFGQSCSPVPWRVLHYGIDLSPLAPVAKQKDIRRELGIPQNAVVIGHVGRFFQQKNHELIVKIAEALRRRTTSFHVVLVGDGPLRAKIEGDVEARSLRNHVSFVGIRADVPRLYASLFDVFLLPSLFEGLPLVMIEALAAGCPAVISDSISTEADMIPSLIKRLSLSASPDQWAAAILESARQPKSYEQRRDAFEAVRNSPFNISNCVPDLTNFYLGELSRRKAA